MSLFAYHGVLSEERTLGQRFLVDLEVDADLRAAGERDELAQTVDYARLYRVVRAAFEGPPCKLLEAASERVARAALNADPRIARVRVQVRKPAAPIQGAILSYAAVRIERRREDFAPEPHQ